VFIVRIVAFFLFSTGLLAFFGFIAATTKEEKFLCGLSTITNLVAAMHYQQIIILRSKVPQTTGCASVINELQVDSLRYSDWAITMIFLVIKLYHIINRHAVAFKHYSVEVAVLLAVLMVLFGAFARIGTDEMTECWNTTRIRCGVGLFALFASFACFVLLLIDLRRSADGIPNNQFLNSFFYVWIGYPLVAVCAIPVRFYTADCQTYSQPLSTAKDICFGGLDMYSKGVFALWTAYSSFGEPLFQNDPAIAYAWPRPPPLTN
jgi:hypothetical protein